MQSGDPRFAPTPEAGAAYRVLFERFRPTECFSEADLRKIAEGTLSVLKWSKEQDKIVQAAYQWGAARVMMDAENRMEIIRNSQQVGAAYAKLLRPPSDLTR